MAVNFLTLRSAVANDMAVQHLTYSTMVGHPTASHQTVQAIVASSIMTMGHVGIGATTALSGTALNVVGSTIISGNVIINNGVGGTLTKTGSTTGYYGTFTGGTASNSPYLEFFASGTRRGYFGNVSLTRYEMFAENGASIIFGTAGSTRMTIGADGTSTHTSGDSSYIKYGPNSTWSSYLVIGATPDRAGASTAQVITTNGNLHLDAGNSSDIYYGLYATQRATPNAHRFSGQVFISGDTTVNGGLTGSEVYANGWFRVNTSGGLYWQAYGRGIYSADSAGASYGNVSVYGTGINSWNGYDINGRYTFMANGDTVGVHDRNNSWVWYNVNTTMYINKRLIVNGQSIEDRLAILEAFMNNTAMRTDRSYYSNMWGYDIGIGSNHHLAMTDGWAPDSGNSAVAMYFRRT